MTTKSYEEYLLGLYKAMLSSIVRIRPRLRVDCERDYKRLLSSVEKGGIRVFLEFLPAMGKHLDICLSQRRLMPSHVAYMAPYKRHGAIPRLFKGLYLSVFDESGELRVDPDVRAVEFLRCLLGAAKKFRMPCSNSSTWEHVNEFYQIDKEIRSPSLNWDDDEFDPQAAADLSIDQSAASEFARGSDLFDQSGESCPVISAQFARYVQWTADCVAAELGSFEASEWDSRHGPGAVADVQRGHDKYSFPHWPAKLDRVFPYSEHAFHCYGEWADSIHDESVVQAGILHEPPSRLIAVPKVITGPRLIACEPAAHQWCQQMILDFLFTKSKTSCLKDCISFSDQSKNGNLALRASSSESHATIDLSSASDRISCWVIERIFRKSPTLLDALQSSRTRWIQNDIDRKSPRFHKLRKFTTMGSAVTFPVQTYLFAIISIASVLFTRQLKVNYRNIRRVSAEVQVFGDDIIVPIDSADNTLAALTHLGLKVNPAKTFVTGKFRESCGVDAYDGNNVTKVSVLSMPVVSKPESVMSSVDSHNNFFLKGYYEVADFIYRTVTQLKNYHFFKVSPGSGALGWYSIEGFDSNGAKRRFNSKLQRVEYLVTGLSSPVKRELTKGSSMLLQYFTEVHAPPISKEIRLGTASVPTMKLSRRWDPLPIR